MSFPRITDKPAPAVDLATPQNSVVLWGVNTECHFYFTRLALRHTAARYTRS